MPDDPRNAATIRDSILRANRAENDLANLGIDGVISAWTAVVAPGSEGFVNGQPHSGTAADEANRAMYGAFPDYHRTWHTVVIEPPFRAVRWTTTGAHRASFMGLPASGRDPQASAVIRGFR